MNCKETDNSIRLYSQNGAIDTANTNAVSFVNGGTSIANLNGFPINPGQCISFGNEKDQCDITKYQVAFINTGLQTNALYVFRGNSGIQFSQIIAAVGGTHDNVNIFDSAGATLTASGGKLTVLDAAVVSAINGLVTSGLATAALQTTLNNSVATAANQTTQIGLETTLNGIVSTAANQISQIALESTLNGIVATKTNQNTEISLLTSLDTNVKSIRIDKIVQPQQVGYNYVGLADVTLMSTVLSGITIASNQIGILSSGPGGGLYTGDSTYFYGAISNSAGQVIFGVTRRGCFIDSWTYNNTYLYSNSTTWNLRVYNKSDLIL